MCDVNCATPNWQKLRVPKCAVRFSKCRVHRLSYIRWCTIGIEKQWQCARGTPSYHNFCWWRTNSVDTSSERKDQNKCVIFSSFGSFGCFSFWRNAICRAISQHFLGDIALFSKSSRVFLSSGEVMEEATGVKKGGSCRSATLTC